MVAISALIYLEPVLDFLYELEDIGSFPGDFMILLLKALGIGLVAEIASSVCSDAGNSSLGKTIHTLGSAAILYLSLPVFRAMVDMIRDILEEV